jgi:hypothetical protein
MNRLRDLLPILAAWLVVAVAAPAAPSGLAPKPLRDRPPGRAATVEQVREDLFAWLADRNADKAVRAKAAEIWAATPAPQSGIELLERVVRILALGDDNARKLVEVCSAPRTAAPTSAPAWLADTRTPLLVRANLRLWYGRWLAQQAMFDEAEEQLQSLVPGEVVDPSTLLFYQSVVYYRLINQDAGLETLDKLLEAQQAPQRYLTVARLMEADLKRVKEDSLDHIARRMEDVRRRLELGRAGNKVREVEDGVIKSLDKLIKEMEDRQQKQQQSMAAGSTLRPSSPAKDSMPMGGKGRGEVTRKDIGNQSGWGNLPPKQREEAMQQIGREFPAHYRDVIEQYFRKLATGGE